MQRIKINCLACVGKSLFSNDPNSYESALLSGNKNHSTKSLPATRQQSSLPSVEFKNRDETKLVGLIKK